MEKSGGGEKQLVGRTVLFEDTRPSVCSNFLARCRPADGVDAAYLNYLMLAIYAGRGTYPHIKQSTGIQNLDMGSYLDTRVSIPSLISQHRIARFLDEKTARIDALIEKKQALLGRLAEMRQALITRAVTKGLNPLVPLKSTCLDALGEIPAHWRLLPLKRLVEPGDGLQMGPFGGMLTDLPSEQTGFKLYGQENTISGDFSRGDRWVEEERFRELQRYELRSGDLVITRKGSLGSCRKVPTSILPGIADSDTIRVRPMRGTLAAEWALMLLHDAQFVADQIASERRGAILSGLNTTVVGSILITVPDEVEQQQIVRHLRGAVSPLDRTRELVNASVDKLHEVRSALITAAVTGQIPELLG
jgi:type I restriction enzyme S subunit